APPAPLLQEPNSDTVNFPFSDLRLRDRFKDYAELVKTCKEFIAYTDGSMSYPTTEQLEMGIGWTLYDPRMNELLSFNSSITLWPSSTRAEMMAVATMLYILPSYSNCHIYLDSECVSRTLIQYLSEPLAWTNDKIVKLNNFLIWKFIF